MNILFIVYRMLDVIIGFKIIKMSVEDLVWLKDKVLIIYGFLGL